MPTPLDHTIFKILSRLEALPASPGAGRSISLCDPGVNQAEGAKDNPNHILSVLLQDMGDVLSPQMLNHLSPVDLEQFGLHTVLMDDSASALLIRLISAFIEAYSQESKADKALDLLREIEVLARSR